MKNFILLFGIFFAFTSLASIQLEPVKYKRQDSDHIKEIMKAWDQDKGEYLYESMASLIMHERQPDRPAGLSQTPFELLQMMDEQRIDRLDRIAEQELENEKKATRGKRDSYYWQEWRKYLESSRCTNMSTGRSNGDPHMTTYDGEKYDFQNAGDYLLSGKDDNRFMIQTQMVRPNNSTTISQNGGVVMNVNGDVVEFRRAEEKDAGMIVINGEEMLVDNADYVLPQGGVIENNRKRSHKVKWPTGEQATVKNRGNSSNRMFDVVVNVPQCKKDQYYGLLGNNDGLKDNDLIVSDQSDEDRRIVSYPDSYDDLFGPNRRNPEVRDRQQGKGRYISHDFGDQFMLTESTSLFAEQMVDIPDELRYPSEHLTLAELSDEQIEEGLKKARENGVAEEDLYGAVYDYGHIGLEPEAHDEDYVQPKREDKYKEPVIDRTNTDAGNTDTNNPPRQVRIPPRVYIGTGVILTPPRPVYRNPTQRYPTSTPSTSNPRRTPSSTPSSNTPTRTPTRTPGRR